MPIRLVVFLLLLGALPAHAQPNPPLDVFIQEQIVQQDVRLQANEESAEYLRALDPGELRIVRNALFAQHGYVFTDSTLQAYFDERDWYEAEDKEVSLSTADEANATFVQSFEDRAQSRLDAFYEKFPPCEFPIRVRLVDGSAGAAGYSRGETVPSMPGSDEGIDKRSVTVLLNDDRFSLHRAGCTIAQTDRYRMVLYAHDMAAGSGVTDYKTATFDATGRHRSKRTLLEFGGSLESSEFGQMTISREEGEILIETKQVRNSFRRVQGERRKTKQEKTWRWFTIGPDGTLRPLLDDR